MKAKMLSAASCRYGTAAATAAAASSTTRAACLWGLHMRVAITYQGCDCHCSCAAAYPAAPAATSVLCCTVLAAGCSSCQTAASCMWRALRGCGSCRCPGTSCTTAGWQTSSLCSGQSCRLAFHAAHMRDGCIELQQNTHHVALQGTALSVFSTPRLAGTFVVAACRDICCCI